MAGAISKSGGLYDAGKIFDALTGYQGTQFSLEALRKENPFLYFSNAFETVKSHLTITEIFASAINDLDPRGLMHNPTARPEQNRSVPFRAVGSLEIRTALQMMDSCFTESEVDSMLSGTIDSLSAAIYNNINQTCQDAINGVVTCTDVIRNMNQEVRKTPEEDNVVTLDATTSGFTLDVALAIRDEFFRNTQQNFVRTDDYYLVIPESARQAFLKSAGTIQALSYQSDLANMKSVMVINGCPVYSPKGDFFRQYKGIKVKGGAAKDCVLGYAVLNKGISIGYKRHLFSRNMVRSTGVPYSLKEIDSMQRAMYKVIVKDAPSTYHEGVVVKVEAMIGAMRTFSGAVVRIALPTTSI